MEQEASSMREQLRESHAHVRNVHQEKQRLERQIHGMRIRASDTPPTTDKSEWFPRAAAPTAGPPGAAVGLRELKLGRSRSTPSQTPSPYNNKRASAMTTRSTNRNDSSESLAVAAPLAPTPQPPPISEDEALLLDLVQAKTSEAVARQELEEMKQKLERLRKQVGLAPGETPPAAPSSSAASGALGMFGRLTAAATAPVVVEPVAAAPASTAGGGGFWGGRR